MVWFNFTITRILFILFFFFYAGENFAQAQSPDFCTAKIFSPFTVVPADQITYLPHYGCLTTLALAGNLSVAEKSTTDTAQLFYWFVASARDPSKDPIVIWLNGGPGASSFYGFFTENGPYGINKKAFLYDKPFSWTKKVNYLMIDNPAGVGFSYADPKHPVLTEAQATDNLYHALENFFLRYPELKQNSVYLAGESYAGKYIAELAIAIQKNDPNMPLKGLLIGDGWVAPDIQQASVPDYAYYQGLIDLSAYQKARHLYQKCTDAIQKGPAYLVHANDICMQIDDFVMNQCGLDRHDIRTLAEIDYQPIERYLNNSAVRAALHVDNRIAAFHLFNNEVSKNLAAEIQKSDLALYEKLLDNHLPILIFNGLEDASDSNFLGTMQWLAKLHWTHAQTFANTPTCIWYGAHHDVAGFARSAQALTQIKIRNAGHMAVMDQPENTLDMLDRFMDHKSFCT